MSCNVCTKKFGLFRREQGCPNCAFSFCSSCLIYTIEVPKFDGRKKKVCPACYEKLSKQKTKVGDSQAEQKAFANLEQKILDEPIPEISAIQLQPSAVTSATMFNPKNSNLKEEDRVIAERLARLKDTEHKEYDHKELLARKETKTHEEQTKALLEQFVEESALDEKTGETEDNTSVDAIARRLAKLKDEKYEDTKEALNKLKMAGDDDSYTNVNSVLKKYLEEAALPDNELEDELELPAKGKGEEEELPWCVICNEDPDIICDSCDGDYYCGKCFRECHDDEDYRSHKTRPFKQSNQKKSTV